MTADVIAQAAINADVARELLLEAKRAEDDIVCYVFVDGLKRPNGTTWAQFREDTIQTLVADALVRLERAVTLLGGPS